MNFRKKPVVIEAFRWTGGIDQDEDPVWICEAIAAGTVRFEDAGTASVSLLIDTLEGTHRANQGDYIIQGIKGELYPCKPGISAYQQDRAALPMWAEGQAWKDASAVMMAMVELERAREASLSAAPAAPGGDGECLTEAAVEIACSKAERGEALSAAEQAAVTGYDLGWRDGYGLSGDNGWRGVDDDPLAAARSGKRVLLFEEGHHYYAGRWNPVDECWEARCGQPVVRPPEPTHWRPLPPPPSTSRGEG